MDDSFVSDLKNLTLKTAETALQARDLLEKYLFDTSVLATEPGLIQGEAEIIADILSEADYIDPDFERFVELLKMVGDQYLGPSTAEEAFFAANELASHAVNLTEVTYQRVSKIDEPQDWWTEEEKETHLEELEAESETLSRILGPETIENLNAAIETYKKPVTEEKQLILKNSTKNLLRIF